MPLTAFQTQHLIVSADVKSFLDSANKGAMRTALDLGSIATQNASSVAITGGTITGITDLAVADGGTGASTAEGARSNLGLTKCHVTLYPPSTFNSVGSAAGGGETNLGVYTIPANTINGNGDWISAIFVFSFASNSNNKRFRIYIGNIVVYDSTERARNGGSMGIEVRIGRASATGIGYTVQSWGDAVGTFAAVTAFGQGAIATPSGGFGANMDLKATGNGTATNDVVHRFYSVSLEPVTL